MKFYSPQEAPKRQTGSSQRKTERERKDRPHEFHSLNTIIPAHSSPLLSVFISSVIKY